jgi:hypothetical protein
MLCDIMVVPNIACVQAAVARSLVMAFLHQVVLFLKLLLSFFVPSANTSSPVGDCRQTSQKQR